MMPTYDVMLVPAVLVKKAGIAAENPRAAIEAAVGWFERECLDLLDAVSLEWDETNFVGYQVDEVGDRDYSKSQFYHDGYHAPIIVLAKLVKELTNVLPPSTLVLQPGLGAALAEAHRVLELMHRTPGDEV